MDINEYFFKLTPDIIIKAVESCGFAPTGHCLALNSFENRVYDLKLQDESHIIAKFYRPARWSKEQILEEHQLIFDLQNDEIPVCAPIRFPDGETIRETEGILFTLWPRIGGRTPDEVNDSQLQVLGRQIARIHNSGAAKRSHHRLTLSPENYALKPLDFLLQNNFLPDHCTKRYSDAVNTIVDVYNRLSQNVPMHRIHGDCHLGNLLHNSDGILFLDFDDCLNGPAVQDIWMIMPGRDSHSTRQMNLFLESYRTFREFDERWLKLIEPLRALRYIHYAGWIARRWQDPAFPKAFPHFGTTEYWENETSDLEEQVDLVTGNFDEVSHSYQKAEPEDEEILSNKDLFWDWEE